MRKTIFVLALALVLVFAVSALAGAKYAGYFGGYNGDRYLSWQSAKAIQGSTGRNLASALQDSPHGGYATSTAKCAVCHSTHRATGNASDSAVTLTASTTCTACHTMWGAAASARPIEWAEASPGPHGSAGHGFGNGCSYCHRGGIHGNGSSLYHAMNVFMLGGDADSEIFTEVDNGTYAARPATVSTAAWAKATAGKAPGTNNTAAATSDINFLDNATGSNSTEGGDWFFVGLDSPQGIGEKPADPSLGAYTAARATATGYTCANEDCHQSSSFANNKWGATVSRNSAEGTTTPTLMTGHRSNPGSNEDHGRTCSPCHAGLPAGGYRFGSTSQDNAKAYGCDQCHDLVGKLTNSTAFPHSNRNIDVLQWDGSGTNLAGLATPKTLALNASTGNCTLWMYKSSMAQTASGSLTFANIVDPTFTPITSVGTTALTGANAAKAWQDAVCLKCHVNRDSASIKAQSSTATNLYAPRHAFNDAYAGAYQALPAADQSYAAVMYSFK